MDQLRQDYRSPQVSDHWGVTSNDAMFQSMACVESVTNWEAEVGCVESMHPNYVQLTPINTN